jgi:hypothetical protein
MEGLFDFGDIRYDLLAAVLFEFVNRSPATQRR